MKHVSKRWFAVLTCFAAFAIVYLTFMSGDTTVEATPVDMYDGVSAINSETGQMYTFDKTGDLKAVDNVVGEDFYTYDEYSAYVDEMKDVLKELAGSSEWPQERVDMVLRLYEESLEGIKNGTLFISKQGAEAVSCTTSANDTKTQSYDAIISDKRTGEEKNLGSFDSEIQAQKAIDEATK